MNHIQKLAEAHVLEAYGLKKLARTRFLELAEQGLLSAADKARLGITQRFTDATGKLKNRMVRSLRGNLYGAATDLGGKQLARHRALGEKIEGALMARHGATIPSSPLGPAASLGGNVIRSGDMTDTLQDAVKLPKRQRGALGTIRRSVAEHELAEGNMAAGAAQFARQQGEHEMAKTLMPSTPGELNKLRDQVRPASEELANTMNLVHPGTTHAYEGKSFASHLGPSALVAEAQPTFRDPAASKYMAQLRKIDPGDAYAMQKMKQFGHTPGYPMPLGGKQHFALEEAMANIPDTHLTQGAVQNRVKLPGSKMPKGSTQNLEAGYDYLNQLEEDGLIDAAGAAAVRSQMDSARERAKKYEGVRTLPYADPQEARRRHMALFAAPRLDANPGQRI